MRDKKQKNSIRSAYYSVPSQSMPKWMPVRSLDEYGLSEERGSGTEYKILRSEIDIVEILEIVIVLRIATISCVIGALQIKKKKCHVPQREETPHG